ncbi:hypothetical protein ACHQM5_005184 [Ranunculus cassubicifolius]
MESDPNMVYNNERIMNSRAVSFQSAIMNNDSGLIPFGGMNNTAGIIFGGSSNKVNDGRGRGRNSIGSNHWCSQLYDTFSGSKHDAGFVVEWSVEEQAKLEEGLVKYANEPNMMRYVKIAASLRDKAVRDVALRCRWMTNESGKRRKQEHYSGRKMKDKKETFMESHANTLSVEPLTVASYPPMMHQMDPNRQIPSQVSETTKHLLEENLKVFNQISSNFNTFKIQENIDLLSRTRRNIADILKEMREVPGIMSQMPPLPVSINEGLANAYLPTTYQAMFGMPREVHLKQEPRC